MMGFMTTRKFADLAVGVGSLLLSAGWLLQGFEFGIWTRESAVAAMLPTDTRYATWLQGLGIVILWVGIVRQWTIQQRINRIAMANGDRD